MNDTIPSTDELKKLLKRLSTAQVELLTEMPCTAVETYPPARTLVEKGIGFWHDGVIGTIIKPTPLGAALQPLIPGFQPRRPVQRKTGGDAQ